MKNQPIDREQVIKLARLHCNVSEIARLELEARRLPFIVLRFMPDGSFETWRLADLLIMN